VTGTGGGLTRNQPHGESGSNPELHALSQSCKRGGQSGSNRDQHDNVDSHRGLQQQRRA
jgi:hypothetical protein